MTDGHADVLIVDDEDTLRQIVSRAIEKCGHNCTTAANGEEALGLATLKAFDLVVTDLKMPRMDGLTLVEILKKQRPDLPIIIMTGYADIESARKALRLQVSDYLVKPFDSLAEVQAAAERAIRTQSSRMGADSMLRELEDRKREFEKREQALTKSLQQVELQLRTVTVQLEKSEAVASKQITQIETIIANVDNGILVTDMTGCVLSFNRVLKRQMQAANLQGTGLCVDRLPGDAALREAIMESQSAPNLDNDVPVEVEAGEPARTYHVRSVRLVGEDGRPIGIVTTVAKGTPRVVGAQ